MATYAVLMNAIANGTYDEQFKTLYGLSGESVMLDAARERVRRVADDFAAAFSGEDEVDLTVFSAPGRTEIGGNHTDHQHGHVLCGSVDLDIIACAAPNGLNMIRLRSAGYSEIKVELDSLCPNENEINTSAALVRGVVDGVVKQGYSVGGVDICLDSCVPIGSGLSSSAAFEVLLGTMLNHFFCRDALDAVQIAQIGQYAENVYFGKPCGLMDQIACAVGGVAAVDFADAANPKVRKVDCNFSAFGHALCIVDSGSCHADLTDDYAEITREMGAVAAHFGASVLRDVPEERFRAEISALRETCGDRAVLRAMHFYEDSARAEQEAEALEEGDFPRFLSLVNASGRSSAQYLQNLWSVSDVRHQAVVLAIAVGERALRGHGAIRVHGGGFAGTVQAFVPEEQVREFQSEIDGVFGAGACRVLHIRPCGGCVLIG